MSATKEPEAMSNESLVFAPANGASGRDSSAGRVTGFARRFIRNRNAAIGASLLLLLVLAAVLAPTVAPYSPTAQFTDEAMHAPSQKFLLGTDTIGRDYLSRIIFGTRISLMVGAISMTIASIVGVTSGLLAGYYGGRLDTLVMRIMDAVLAFPSLLLAIFIVAVLGPSMVNAMIAVGITYTPGFARITRANVLSVKEKEYIEAARAIGSTDRRILFRHVLSNCLSPLIVQFTLGVGYAILVEASLSFLGLGVQPPTPAWGQMLGFGRDFMTMAPWLTTFPGIAIFLTVLSFNFVGDGLREALDPRLQERSGR